MKSQSVIFTLVLALVLSWVYFIWKSSSFNYLSPTEIEKLLEENTSSMVSLYSFQDNDLIELLNQAPYNTNLRQYGGYVSRDSAAMGIFYYRQFMESPRNYQNTHQSFGHFIHIDNLKRYISNMEALNLERVSKNEPPLVGIRAYRTISNREFGNRRFRIMDMILVAVDSALADVPNLGWRNFPNPPDMTGRLANDSSVFNITFPCPTVCDAQ
jgi:hypothetical protein